MRITLFLGLALATLYLFAYRWRPSNLFTASFCAFLVSAAISATFFILFQTVSFASEGSSVNALLTGGFKYLLIPVLPFIYMLWDFLKAPYESSMGLNIVQFSFSVYSIVILSTLLPFFLFIFSRSLVNPRPLPRPFWGMTSIVLAIPMCSGYVHVRYLYEFIPWVLVAFSFMAGGRYIYSWLFRWLPSAAMLKIVFGLCGLLSYSPNLPVYSLPPHLI